MLIKFETSSLPLYLAKVRTGMVTLQTRP